MGESGACRINRLPNVGCRARRYLCNDLFRRRVVHGDHLATCAGSESSVDPELRIHGVPLTSRSAERLAKAKTALLADHPALIVETYSVSVTDYARMSQIMRTVATIDIVLFAAVREQSFTAADQILLTEMEELFQTNVIAPYEMVKTFVAMPEPRSGGRKTFLGISSCAAHVSLLAGYGASKVAFAQMVARLAENEERKPEGERVRMFCYHPGIVYTDGVSRDKFTPAGCVDFGFADSRFLVCVGRQVSIQGILRLGRGSAAC